MSLLISGCGSESEVSVYDVKVDKIPHPRSLGNNFYTWEPPADWHFFKMLSPFQDALFFAPDKSDADMQNDHTTAQVSLSFIENVEFDASSNVARWQKQLSENVNDVSVEKALIETNLGEWFFYKLNYKSQSMYVAVYESFEGTLFLKMVGPTKTVKQQAEQFLTFMESVEELDG